MKKLLLLLFIAGVLSSCSEKEASGDAQMAKTGIKVILPDITSRLGYSEGPDYLVESKWEDGDEIAIIYTGNDNYGINKYSVDPASIAQDGKSAYFMPESALPSHGKAFLAFYPYAKAPQGDDDMISPEGQVQDGNNSMQHLAQYDFMQSIGYYEQGKDIYMRRMMAMMTFDMTVPSAAAKNITELEVSSSNPELFKKKTILGHEENLNNLVLAVKNVSVSEDASAVLHIMVYPAELNKGDKLFLTLKCSDNSEYRYTKTFEERTELAAGKRLVSRFTDVLIINYAFAENYSPLPEDLTTFTLASYDKSTQSIDEVTNGMKPFGTYVYHAENGRALQAAEVESDYPYNFVADNNNRGQILKEGEYSTVLVTPACTFSEYQNKYYIVFNRNDEVKVSPMFDNTIEGDAPVVISELSKPTPLGANITFNFQAAEEEAGKFQISNLVLHNAGQRGWYNPVDGTTLLDFAESGDPDLTSTSTQSLSVTQSSPTLFTSESARLFAQNYSVAAENGLKITFDVTYSDGNEPMEVSVNREILDGYDYNFDFFLNAVDKSFTLTVTSWQTVGVEGSID